MNAIPNPKVLRWARETAGLSVTEAAHQLGIKPIKGSTPEERLLNYESGDIETPKNLVVKMSKKYYRPFIIFYLDKPPIKGDRGKDFRTLPKDYSVSSNALVDALIRDVLVRQSIIKSAIQDEEDIQPLNFVASANPKVEITHLANSISRSIAFDLDEFRKQPTTNDAFKYLRGLVEKKDIFVLILGNLGSWHTNIDVELFRGFTLSDKIAPFIVINENDSKSAWCFTLLHELAHLWLGQTGVSNEYSNLAIEKFCNNVASEILLPKDDMKPLENINSSTKYDDLEEEINKFSTQRNISNTMVAYKLYLNGNITYDIWEKLRNNFYDLWQKSRAEIKKKFSKNKGGPTYTTLRSYSLGKHLVSLVSELVSGGDISTSKASRVLGVSPTNMQKLTQNSMEYAIG